MKNEQFKNNVRIYKSSFSKLYMFSLSVIILFLASYSCYYLLSGYDFGLTANNPIELISVGAQYQYLNILLTDDGKDILYERVGTVTHSDGETIIDVYNIYSKKN